MKIEIYSDLICPWCYIGKRRMQAGLKLLGKEFNPKIVWRPFQLNVQSFSLECWSTRHSQHLGTVEMIGPSHSAGAGRDALPRVRRCSLDASFCCFCERALALSELRLFPISLTRCSPSSDVRCRIAQERVPTSRNGIG